MNNMFKWWSRIGSLGVWPSRYLRWRNETGKPIIPMNPVPVAEMTASVISSDTSDKAGNSIEGYQEEVIYYSREKRAFYNGETYGDLPGTLFNDFRIWRDVTTSLPDDYVLPNPESVRILMPMTADFYHSLFLSSSARADLMVDDQIWKRIKAALPPHYRIPDLV
jgi:hypothetical protein